MGIVAAIFGNLHEAWAVYQRICADAIASVGRRVTELRRDVMYVQDWEPIADALKRVVATGLAGGDAKRQPCAAIAVRKIELRIILAEDPTRGMPEQSVSGAEFAIPPRLSPADIDWAKSQPLTDWPPLGHRPGQPMMTMLHIDRIKHLVERKIAEIQLRTADVAAILDTPSKSISASLPPNRAKSRAAAGAKSRVVLQARRGALAQWYSRRPNRGPRTIQRALSRPNG